jgi:hypothetical protein
LAGLRDAQITCKTLFLAVSMSVFLEEKSSRIRRSSVDGIN